MVRVAAVIPVVLLVLFTGLLWLLGLICGRERRRYVTNLTQLAMSAVGGLLHEASDPAPGLSRIQRQEPRRASGT
jgi:hypothetical protein